MSVTKDGKTERWMSQIRVKDWTGRVIHKKKRGFATKKAALQWERDYLNQATASLGMSFHDFIGLYFKDMESRLKPTTLANKHFIIDQKIEPYFGHLPLSAIKATDVRHWQNSLTAWRGADGEPYSPTYLKYINNQLTAIFNYAVKYYGLKENPCHKAGSIGKKKAEEMMFWTREEFAAFISAVKDKPQTEAIFMTLYYTGMRKGELLALTVADVDLAHGTISISKSYQRLNRRDFIMPPKTPKSNRVVTMPAALVRCLAAYIAQLPGEGEERRLFCCAKTHLVNEMERGCRLSGVKRIRIHDIRHSHASLLVELGFSPLLIAERLGHEKVQTTMETYSHLYPNKQLEVVARLDALIGE